MRAAVVLLAVLCAPAAARAEPWPGRLVLDEGTLEAAGTVEIDLYRNRVGQPTSLAIDAWWGATDRLTVGVITSARAHARYEAGHGLCVHGCDRLYDNLGLDGLYELAPWAAARLRLVARSFDPFKPSLRPGARLRWRRAPWAIEGDPHLQLGLANRGQGNRDQLNLPVWLRAQLGCRASMWLFTGARGELAGFFEKVAIPLGLGAVARIGPVDVGAEVGFPSLLGPQNQLLSRQAWLWVGGEVR